MPTRVVARVPDMSAEEVADLFVTAQLVQRGMETLHGVSSSTVCVQDGPDAGQTIQQVHVHVLPRRPKDFAKNDDVYDALANHDKGAQVEWRSDDDMRREADQLRRHFRLP